MQYDLKIMNTGVGKNMTDLELKDVQIKNLKSQVDYLRSTLDNSSYIYDVEKPCKCCGGLGRRVYPNTTTWRGGMGGQQTTSDVCDKCWGSGDQNCTWLSLRKLSVFIKTVKSINNDLRSTCPTLADMIDNSIETLFENK
jgi:hypothetical protein